MLRTGRVVAVEADRVSVCFERPEACARCGACAGRRHQTVASIPGSARVGQTVDVEMPDAQVVKASLLAYVLPLGMLLLGVLLGARLFAQEALGAALGVVLMLSSWGVLRLIEKRMRSARAWQPRIVAVHEEGEEQNGNDADG